MIKILLKGEFMFETIIDAINTFLYSKLLIVILIGSGIYFTIRAQISAGTFIPESL